MSEVYIRTGTTRSMMYHEIFDLYHLRKKLNSMTPSR
ncbi:hypothetical protein SAMN05444972_102342 [Marininema halotolerans]|uniref:Uncharacterized protein n=1 Tax=Marininema halotolerans TaxID=1155944 RepID=A0A1I6Q526_9BACL|nr:hypothetical protein SAMN05444972_102342 [Marininema halotolerans]